jgi:hypothetical protein
VLIVDALEEAASPIDNNIPALEERATLFVTFPAYSWVRSSSLSESEPSAS